MYNHQLRLILLAYASARAAAEHDLPSMNGFDALTTPQRLTRRTHKASTHSLLYAASPVADPHLPSPQSSARAPTWGAFHKQITSAGDFSPFDEAALSDGATLAQHEKTMVRRVAHGAEADAVAIDGAGVIAPADKQMPSSAGLGARPSQSLAQVKQPDAATLPTTAMAETLVPAAGIVADPAVATLTSTALTAKMTPVAALAPAAQVAAVAAVPAAPVPAAPVVPAAVAPVAPAAAAPVAAAPVATAPVAAAPAESGGGFGIGAMLTILLFIGMLSVLGVLALKWHSRRREAGRLAAMATNVRKQSDALDGGSYRKTAMNLPTNDSGSDNGSESKGLSPRQSSLRRSGTLPADSPPRGSASSASMSANLRLSASYRDRRAFQKQSKGSNSSLSLGSKSVPLNDGAKLLDAEDDEEDVAL